MSVRAQMTGLQSLEDIAQGLETFKNDAYLYFRSKIKTDWKQILFNFQEENLDLGIRPDKTPIEKTPVNNQKSTRYERYTIYLKEKRGLEFNSEIVTLKETGLFRSSIDIEVGTDVLYFIDRDSKADVLESIWGQVLGVTEEQLFNFTELIRPEFEEWAKNKIFKK